MRCSWFDVLLFGIAVDERRFYFGVHDLLAAVEAIISGLHITDCDSYKVKGRAFEAEHFKTDQQGGNGAVGDAAKYGGHAAGGGQGWGNV